MHGTADPPASLFLISSETRKIPEILRSVEVVSAVPRCTCVGGAGETNDQRLSNFRFSLLVMIHHDEDMIPIHSEKR